MDVIFPDLQWIDGICYRINDRQEFVQMEYTEYDEGDDMNERNDDDVDDEDANIEFVTLPNGRVMASMHVAQAFHGTIIGAKGSALKRLMNETSTDIKLPRRNAEGDVSITGPDKRKVASAVRRIQMIVFSARRKMRPTHFVSMRLTSDEIVQNFNKFKEDVLSNYCDEGVDDSIFTLPTKLHLTLTILCFMDMDEIETGANILREAKTSIIEPLLKEPLKVRLQGVAIMNDDPKQAHVLFAKIEETGEANKGVLTVLFEKLIELFSDNGFDSSREGCKLHVTLMNTTKRGSDEAEDEKINYNKKRVSFDATRILQAYEGFYFGEHAVTEINLSQMHGTGADGYYATSLGLQL